MTDQIQVQQVESVLKQIQELKEEDERDAKATGKNFNVFSVPGFGYNELDHSAFLANLLNPEGTHSQGVVFLRYFLKQLDPLDCENLEDFKVTPEAYVGVYGRIDILLEKDDACIIIENKINDEERKIYAEHQAGQLNRYYMYAKEKFTDDQIKLIYLTPNGRRPSEDSLRGEDGQKPLDVGRVICMSYESHIVKWLEECIKKVVEIDPIREVLLQYQMLVKEPIGDLVNEELIMKVVKVLTEKYDLISLLELSIPEAKKRILDKFWEGLYKGIPERCGIEKCSKEPEERIKGCPEIEFKVPSFKADKFDIGLRIQLEKSGNSYRVCYGFCLLENNKSVDKCREGHFDRHVELIRDALCMRNRKDFWLGWKSLKSVSMADFVRDDKLKKLVKSITDESKIAVKIFKEKAQEKGLL